MYEGQVDSSSVLPCPFCGERKDFLFRETQRSEKVRTDKRGIKMQRIRIKHVVSCVGCGALGPEYHSSTVTDLERALTDATELLPEHIDLSHQEAIFAWNQRQPISDRAYELVNKLMAHAISEIDKL